MFAALRIWRDTRWFMKHWQFSRQVSRLCAEQREHRLQEMRYNAKLARRFNQILK